MKKLKTVIIIIFGLLKAIELNKSRVFIMLLIFLSKGLTAQTSNIDSTLVIQLPRNNKFERTHSKLIPLIQKECTEKVLVIDLTQPSSHGIMNNLYLNKKIYDLYKGRSGILYHKRYYRKYLDEITCDSVFFFGGWVETDVMTTLLVIESQIKDKYDLENFSTEQKYIKDEVESILLKYYDFDSIQLKHKIDFLFKYLEEQKGTELFQMFQDPVLVSVLVSGVCISSTPEFITYLQQIYALNKFIFICYSDQVEIIQKCVPNPIYRLMR